MLVSWLINLSRLVDCIVGLSLSRLVDCIVGLSLSRPVDCIVGLSLPGLHICYGHAPLLKEIEGAPL